jgi:hypothetical protein
MNERWKRLAFAELSSSFDCDTAQLYGEDFRHTEMRREGVDGRHMEGGGRQEGPYRASRRYSGQTVQFAMQPSHLQVIEAQRYNVVEGYSEEILLGVHAICLTMTPVEILRLRLRTRRES